MTTMMIFSPSGLLLGVGSLAAFVWMRRKRTKSSKTAAPSKTLPPPPPSPFAPGSGCTEVAGVVEMVRWVKEVVEPIAGPLLEAYDVERSDHEGARRALEQIVDQIYAKAAPGCPSDQTTATRKIWKALWCEVAVALIKQGKLDEELDDLVGLCVDVSFDPRAPLEPDAATPTRKPPKPPGAHPLPPFPMPMDGSATEPMDGAAAELPTNVWTASSRQELAELGVMRLMEGTAGGAPIMGRAARVVMLAFNRVWPGIGQARDDMQRLAAEHPGVSFVEVSFADTQRHFGKPLDVNGIMWALASAAPDGRVYPSPIARHDPRDAPPTPDQWSKVIAHASGYVGFGQVRSMVRPRRFGDVVRAMANARPRPAPVTPKARPAASSVKRPRPPMPGVRAKKTSGRPTPRRGG